MTHGILLALTDGEAEVVRAVDAPGSGAKVVRRCADLIELLGGIGAGIGTVAVLSSQMLGVDRASVGRLVAAGAKVLLVGPTDDVARLGRLGAHGTATESDPPETVAAMAIALARGDRVGPSESSRAAAEASVRSSAPAPDGVDAPRLGGPDRSGTGSDPGALDAIGVPDVVPESWSSELPRPDAAGDPAVARALDQLGDSEPTGPSGLAGGSDPAVRTDRADLAGDAGPAGLPDVMEADDRSEADAASDALSSAADGETSRPRTRRDIHRRDPSPEGGSGAVSPRRPEADGDGASNGASGPAAAHGRAGAASSNGRAGAAAPHSEGSDDGAYDAHAADGLEEDGGDAVISEVPWWLASGSPADRQPAGAPEEVVETPYEPPPVPVEDEGPGRLVVVWGTRGAPGRTTIAVNLAAEAAAAGVRTVLVDADTEAPSLAQVLGLTDDISSIAAVTRMATHGRLDAGTAKSALSGVADDLTALTGLTRPDRWRELEDASLEPVWEVLREVASLVVVDVAAGAEENDGGDFSPARHQATLSALAAADEVVVVGAADPVGMRRLVLTLTELRERGLAEAAGRTVVVNRVRKAAAGPDPSLAVREALYRYAGIEDAVLVPDDPATADSALLRGTSWRESAPSSAVRRAVEELAGRLLDLPRTAAARRRWWRRGARA